MDDKRDIYFCGKSGIYNGENYSLKPFKNIIGEKATLELFNNMNNPNASLYRKQTESIKYQHL